MGRKQLASDRVDAHAAAVAFDQQAICFSERIETRQKRLQGVGRSPASAERLTCQHPHHVERALDPIGQLLEKHLLARLPGGLSFKDAQSPTSPIVWNIRISAGCA